jgi:hypothetical protein
LPERVVSTGWTSVPYAISPIAFSTQVY